MQNYFSDTNLRLDLSQEVIFRFPAHNFFPEAPSCSSCVESFRGRPGPRLPRQVEKTSEPVRRQEELLRPRRSGDIWQYPRFLRETTLRGFIESTKNASGVITPQRRSFRPPPPPPPPPPIFPRPKLIQFQQQQRPFGLPRTRKQFQPHRPQRPPGQQQRLPFGLPRGVPADRRAKAKTGLRPRAKVEKEAEKAERGEICLNFQKVSNQKLGRAAHAL